MVDKLILEPDTVFEGMEFDKCIRSCTTCKDTIDPFNFEIGCIQKVEVSKQSTDYLFIVFFETYDKKYIDYNIEFIADIYELIELLGNCYFAEQLTIFANETLEVDATLSKSIPDLKDEPENPEQTELDPKYQALMEQTTTPASDLETEIQPEQDKPKKTRKNKKDYPTADPDDTWNVKLAELKAESKKLFSQARDIDFTKAYPHKAKIVPSYEEYSLKFDRHGENLEIVRDITEDKGIETPLRDILRAGLQPALRDSSTFKYGDNINKNATSLQKIRDRKKELEKIISNTETQLKEVNKNLDQVTQLNEFAKQVAQATQTTETEKKGGN